MRRMPTVCSIVMLYALACTLTLADGAPRKKLIAVGWDMANPERFLKNMEQMETRPFQGVVLRFAGPGNKPAFWYTFSREPWDPAEVNQVLEDLKQCKPESLLDNFLLVNANPGDVDWFDDEGFAVIVDHWRAAARGAKQGGCKGILFDPEAYREPYAQFRYSAQPQFGEHSFEEYCQKARQRGREMMTAVTEEYPDITIFSFFMLSATRLVAERENPQAALAGDGYGLLPPFIDGWLDVLPPEVTLIDGCESAYRYNTEVQYLDAANAIKGVCQRLVSPENRYKYRAQVQVSFGMYLDAYVNPPDSNWYIDPGEDSIAERLRKNTEIALRVCDEYVWVYGEKAQWWPSPIKHERGTWPEALPGIEDALLAAGDPVRLALKKLEQAGPDAANMIVNGDFSQPNAATPDGAVVVGGEPGGPPGWGFWQSSSSHGTRAWDREVGADTPGSASMAGVSWGCFTQGFPAQPGERYVVVARCKNQGKQGWPTIRVRWQTAEGKWYAEHLDRVLDPRGPDDGWREIVGMATVPEGAGKLFILLQSGGQVSAEDICWFDDVRVVKVE